MLSKKQYRYTLVIAILVFILAFAIAYFYMKQNAWDIETSEQKNNQLSLTMDLPVQKEEVCILPQTKILLKSKNTHQKAICEAKVDAKSLLGLTETELAKQFKEYTIETFNEREVVLVKRESEEPIIENREVVYVLAIEDQYVCIKEKGTSKRPVKIDYEISHLSKYIYSLLLNEEIEITSAQKEALLLNPSKLQRILQGYDGE